MTLSKAQLKALEAVWNSTEYAREEAVHADRVLGDAEDAFDDLLTAYRREINFVK